MFFTKILAYTSLAASFCLAAPIQGTSDASLLSRDQHGSIDDHGLGSRGQHGSLDDAPAIVTRSDINENSLVVTARGDGNGNPHRTDVLLSATDTADNDGSVRARRDSGGELDPHIDCGLCEE
ncbi:hypothetical protein NpPPO83_00004388 [Neofusicoccum parvum]|uniref:Uncharacterized protein n=1 Tax=Neofusicoccum parvum TaxID=310453 RepID=A0ACB5SNB8_9PEZI|nr:hypothetical protein NpPPO83_00004388 [Neofusicoccum parvum]